MSNTFKDQEEKWENEKLNRHLRESEEEKEEAPREKYREGYPRKLRGGYFESEEE